ncbi:hypothetical protein TorRG33x02_123860, partial [Trema orientale]
FFFFFFEFPLYFLFTFILFPIFPLFFFFLNYKFCSQATTLSFSFSFSLSFLSFFLSFFLFTSTELFTSFPSESMEFTGDSPARFQSPRQRKTHRERERESD